MRAFAVLVLATAVIAGCRAEPYALRGTVLEPPSTAPELELTDQSGAPFRIAQARGSVVALYFGFTSCPDLCPTTFVDLAQVKKKLGADGARLRVALVTLDPERDSPAVLGRYVALFDPTFVGLSGSDAALAAAKKAYGVTSAKRLVPESAMGYTIDHSAFIYIVDPKGAWREVFEHGAPVDDIVSDVRFLLREGGS